jgi:hypothetical protein
LVWTTRCCPSWAIEAHAAAASGTLNEATRHTSHFTLQIPAAPPNPLIFLISLPVFVFCGIRVTCARPSDNKAYTHTYMYTHITQ